MPISSNNARLSIDFGWEHVFPNGERATYQMKFYHSDIGGIIQIGNGVYEPFEVPVEMFTEVVEYLISQGVIKGQPMQKMGGLPGGVGGKGTSGLPSLPGKKPTLAPPVKAEPVQSFQQHASEEAQPQPGVVSPPGETDEMMKARMAAAAQAKVKGEKNKFRTGHKENAVPAKAPRGKTVIPADAEDVS